MHVAWCNIGIQHDIINYVDTVLISIVCMYKQLHSVHKQSTHVQKALISG